MVGDVFSLKSLEQNRRTREDFPTAASPVRVSHIPSDGLSTTSRWAQASRRACGVDADVV